ncbi:MAG: tRNA threonylcarbamoyladenosine dehydratase [Bacteroidaceae bacterium]|nr:tRNA threonylcarbamoyladenosine dehydratase [Bacteroidaceae bacterium]
MDPIFNRATLLLGADVMQRLAESRVIIFGIGGVGSWCAESLIRTGLGHLTIVDNDVVCSSNINRQLMATTRTVGRPKVLALRERLLEINPDADVAVREQTYTASTADDFDLDAFDYVIDAIDSLHDKALLIERACQSRTRLFSSMGAALKMDPSRIRIAEFWKVQGDPLARALRNLFKRQGRRPRRKFQCVYSDELMHNRSAALPEHEATANKRSNINGSLMHITSIFGCTLAGLVLQDIARRTESDERVN